MKHIILLTYFLFIGLSIPGCLHNYEPIISMLFAEPNPAQPGDIVTITCKASDDDDGNILKDESLSYTWYAAVGEIISGSQNNIATWTAPQQSGKYSISCSVSDQSNGEDIKTIEVIIQ